MKNLVKLFGIITLVVIIGFTITACDLLGGGGNNPDEGGNGGNDGGGGGGGGTNPTITIKNNTGYTIGGGATSSNGIWIRPSTSTSWGDNLAYWSSDSLSDRQSKAFTLSQHLSTNRVYDIRLSGSGFNFIKNNVTVSEGMILTFTTSDLE